MGIVIGCTISLIVGTVSGFTFAAILGANEPEIETIYGDEE